MCSQHTETDKKNPGQPTGSLGFFMFRAITVLTLVVITAANGFCASIERETEQPNSKRLLATLPASYATSYGKQNRVILPSAPLKPSFKADVITTSAPPAHTFTERTAPETPAIQLLQVEDEGITVDDVLIPVPEPPPGLSPNSTASSVSSPLLPASPLNNLNITPRPKKTIKKIVINIPARQLSLYDGKTLLKTYPVGVGRPGFPTPVGKYEVIRKVLNPGWENPYQAPGKVRILPGMENPLGTRWIGFKEDSKGEYGIHGTDDPPSVGKYSSHGCVRMYVKQAEEIYNQVNVGTPVEVVYQPVVIQQKQNQLWVTVYPDSFRRGIPSLKTVQVQINQQYPNSKINLAQLQQALKLPNQKPLLIGQIIVPPTMATTPAPTQNNAAKQAPQAPKTLGQSSQSLEAEVP